MQPATRGVPNCRPVGNRNWCHLYLLLALGAGCRPRVVTEKNQLVVNFVQIRWQCSVCRHVAQHVLLETFRGSGVVFSSRRSEVC